MTEPQWRYHTPERDGHAPDDWEEGMEWDYPEYVNDPVLTRLRSKPCWWADVNYCYRPAQSDCPAPLQDATCEPDLLAQCLALPQDQREALIEAMQKPQRDWADDVLERIRFEEVGVMCPIMCNEKAAAVIRSMCRPKDVTDALVTMLQDVRPLLPARYTTAQKPLYDALDALIREALS